jgi:hypothetical protein
VIEGRSVRNLPKQMKKYKFRAKIEAGDGGGAYVLFPYDTKKEFATKGRVPVKATFNGLPYTGSLIKYGHPLHSLGMPKAITEQLLSRFPIMLKTQTSRDRDLWQTGHESI